jgi:hypothetical protein
MWSSEVGQFLDIDLSFACDRRFEAWWRLGGSEKTHEISTGQGRSTKFYSLQRQRFIYFLPAFLGWPGKSGRRDGP